MNIGDKVRLLHYKGEGIITKIIDERMVEVEIEEGFSMPALKSEVVLIAREEAITFKKELSENENTAKDLTRPSLLFADRGIFVAFFAINDKIHHLYFINNTDFELPYAVSEESNQTIKGIAAGCLSAKSHQKIKEVSLENFENWGTFIFQILYFKKGNQTLREPMLKRIRFRASTFFKSKQTAPILGKQAYTFQLDRDEKEEWVDTGKIEEVKIDPQKIKEMMLEKNTPVQENLKLPKPELEIDLHIEKLTKDFAFMNNAEILNLQLEIFEKSLENAIANGMKEITFIHGVGNGVLRTEIHKKLSKNSEIKFYEDAQKEKFGYGATLIKLK